MSDALSYVYAVGRDLVDADLADLDGAGVGEGDPRLVVASGLAAVVSDVPRDEFEARVVEVRILDVRVADIRVIETRVGEVLVGQLGLVLVAAGETAPFQRLEALAQPAVLVLQLAVPRGLGGIALPPVDPHLLGPVDRGHHEPQLDRQQLDVQQVDLDVAGDDDALVQDAFEDVGEVPLDLRARRLWARRAGGQAASLHAHAPWA